MDDKLIAGRLEAIADALEEERWTKETAAEELRFIAKELKQEFSPLEEEQL